MQSLHDDDMHAANTLADPERVQLRPNESARLVDGRSRHAAARVVDRADARLGRLGTGVAMTMAEMRQDTAGDPAVDGTRIVSGPDRVTLRGFGLGGWMNMENFITGYPGTDRSSAAHSAGR